MSEEEQHQREKAYKLWEDEGRPEGRHDDHWKRAGEPEQLADQVSEDVTKTNQQADQEFAGDGNESTPATDLRQPSTISPD